MGINRTYSLKRVPVVSNTCESPPVDLRRFATGAIHVPAAWTAAAIAFKASESEDGAYDPVYDEGGVLLRCASVAADRVVSMPSEVTALGFARLWSEDGSGGDVNQSADRDIFISLKG